MVLFMWRSCVAFGVAFVMKSATISKAGHFEGNCPLHSTGPSDSRPVSEGFAAATGPAKTLISPMIVTLPHSPGGAYQAQHSRLIPQEFFQANIPPGVIRGSPFQVCVPPGCSQAGQRVQFRCPCNGSAQVRVGVPTPEEAPRCAYVHAFHIGAGAVV